MSLVALVGLIPAITLADRLMKIPTGTKLLYRRLRAEVAWEPTKPHNYLASLAYGITREFEGEIFLDRLDRRPSVVTGDFSYNYISPVIDTLPGLSVGVRDVADKTRDGRQFYLAITYRLSAESNFNNDIPLELTLGAGTGRRMPLFLGVRVPFTWQTRLLAEHDGNQPRVGLEYLPYRNVVLRASWDEQRTLVGVRWTARF